jgi:hypothetical protein
MPEKDERHWPGSRPVAFGLLETVQACLFASHLQRTELRQPSHNYYTSRENLAQNDWLGSAPSTMLTAAADPGLPLVRGGTKPEYRRRKDRDTWHWCRNCSIWPTLDYVSQNTKPTTGELDNECLAKDDKGDCKS